MRTQPRLARSAKLAVFLLLLPSLPTLAASGGFPESAAPAQSFAAPHIVVEHDEATKLSGTCSGAAGGVRYEAWYAPPDVPRPRHYGEGWCVKVEDHEGGVLATLVGDEACLTRWRAGGDVRSSPTRWGNEGTPVQSSQRRPADVH